MGLKSNLGRTEQRDGLQTIQRQEFGEGQYVSVHHKTCDEFWSGAR